MKYFRTKNLISDHCVSFEKHAGSFFLSFTRAKRTFSGMWKKIKKKMGKNEINLFSQSDKFPLATVVVAAVVVVVKENKRNNEA